MQRLAVIVGLLMVGMMAVPSVAGSSGKIGEFEEDYVALGTHINLAHDTDDLVPAYSTPEYSGGWIVECDEAPPAGGACFPLDNFESQDEFFVEVESASGNDASILAGFDSDGNGCIACGGEDDYWKGVNSVGGWIPADLADETLYVFVHAAAYEESDGQPVQVTATGTVTTSIYEPGTSPCSDGVSSLCGFYGHSGGNHDSYAYGEIALDPLFGVA